MSFIVKNLMLSGYFLELKCEKAPKVPINDRLYKVFCSTFWEAVWGVQSGIPGLSGGDFFFFEISGPGQAATSFF